MARKPHYRTVFISDVHLGNPKNQSDKLIKFLDSITFDNLIIVWDFLDFWQLDWFGQRWEKEQKTLDYINDLANNWVKISYIQWNHDSKIECNQNIHLDNISIYKDMYYTTWKWKTYFVTHWDCLDSVNSKYDRIWIFWSKFFWLWLNIEHLWNKQVFDVNCLSIPEKIDRRIKSRRVPEDKIRKKIINFSKNLKSDWIILWHFHLPTHERLWNLDYFNTWDWLRSYSTIVENSKWDLELCFYQESN